MVGLVCFPKISTKISREKVYAYACALPIAGFILLGIAGFIAPKSAVLVVICCALLFFGSGLSLGVTTCCMADVIDYGEVKFGVGLQVVGYNAKAAVQSAGTILGIRVLMIVIPVILAVVSFLIYKKCYKLKGAAMEEVTEKVNEIHAQRKIVTE